MNKNIRLEGIVFDIRTEVRDQRSFRYIAENIKGETVFVNPFLYKRIIGGKFNGKDVYSMEEK